MEPAATTKPPEENLSTPFEYEEYLNSLLILPERRWIIYQFADQDIADIDTFSLYERRLRYIGSLIIREGVVRAYRFHEGLVGEVSFGENLESIQKALQWGNDLVINKK